MNYIFIYGAREPITENTMKVYDVEKRRMERGENWGDKMIFPIHYYVTQYKTFFVVDTDDEIKVARCVENYAPTWTSRSAQ